MRDKQPKSYKQQLIVIRDAACRDRIALLAALPDEELIKLIDKSLF